MKKISKYNFLKGVVYFLLLTHLQQPAKAQLIYSVSKANEIWHNTLSAQLGLQTNEFKLYQGTATIGYTSLWIWKIYDAVTNSTGIYYDPAQYNSFSSNYGLLLFQSMVPADSVNDNCSLEDAFEKYIEAANKYAWNKTIDELNLSVDTAGLLNINVDTIVTTYSDTGMGTKQITIRAFFKHIGVFYAYPYSVKDSSYPVFNKYKPWYKHCALKMIYENDNNSILTPAQWNSAFGDNGYLSGGICVALVVAADGNIEITERERDFFFESVTVFKDEPKLLGVVLYSIKEFVNH